MTHRLSVETSLWWRSPSGRTRRGNLDGEAGRDWELRWPKRNVVGSVGLQCVASETNGLVADTGVTLPSRDRTPKRTDQV